MENLPLSYNMDTKSLDRTPSLGAESTPDGKPFKRGHIRRSSYESAQIQLNFARRSTSVKGTPAIAQPIKCIDEASCSMSFNDKPDCASSTSSEAVDSGLGESESKHSSLDRRSELSDWEEAVVKPVDETPKGRFFSFPKKFFARSKGEKTSWLMFGGTKTKDQGIFHTTGLILEERPSNLPAKSDDEAARHRQLYYDIIEQTKKKELRAEKERRQARAVQKRLEEQAVAACRVWTEQILPKWSEMCDSKRCRELWWQGIPPKVRGRVWALVVGNDLNITSEIYEIHSVRAEERLRNQACDSSDIAPNCREHTVSQIHLDVSRTFPTLGIFQKGGPYYDHLLKLLSIYACYRPDVGYVQSMSFIAAVLLLQMEPFPAFIVFANLLNRPLQVVNGFIVCYIRRKLDLHTSVKLLVLFQSAFFGLRQPQMTEYFIAYDLYLEQELLGLHQHLDKLDVRPDVYLIEWIYTLFSKSLPLDVTCRIWDVYLRDGEEFIFKTALGILRMYESRLLSMDFDGCVEFLTRLPDSLCGADLFRNIELFMRPYASTGDTSKSKKGFLQILQEVDKRVNPGGSVAHAQINSNVQGMKMSKSLSGFIGDLLGAS